MKRILFFAALVILCMAFTTGLAANSADTPPFSVQEALKPAASPPAFTLPGSLLVIEEEAFEGTAVTEIRLPEMLTTIGDRAFANTENLRRIYIPESTVNIGTHILAGTRAVTVTGDPGSYAGDWAKKQGIPFSPLITLTAGSTTVQISGTLSGKTRQKDFSASETTEEDKPSLPKGRTEGDVKAAQHEECFAYSLQSRSPPARG